MMTADLFLFSSGEAHTQIRGNVLGKLWWQPGNLGNVALIPSAPKLGTSSHVDQFRPQHDVVALAGHAPRKNGLHAEITPNSTDIHLMLAVPTDGRPRHHLQSTQLGKIVDHLLGNSIAQILSIRIASGV